MLGRKVELQMVDDACTATVAYEAAKAFLSDGVVAGVIGGMCDEAAEREVPVIDSTGIPFLVTAATANDLVTKDSAVHLHDERHRLPAGAVERCSG